MKKCSKCGKVKTLKGFYKDRKSTDDRRSECKECAWAGRSAPSGVTIKKCLRCKEDKSFNKFYKNTSGVYGIMSLCKECYKIYRKEYFKSSPHIRERTYEKHRDWRKDPKNRKRENDFDCHMKRKLCNGTDLKKEDIPPELVALKRKQLNLWRKVVQNKNESTIKSIINN